jgi:hypothetical protein
MLADAKELYDSAEARANSTIKQEEELVAHVHVVEERERAVDELEQKLQEREALEDIRLERELAGLATHGSSLESHEATLAAEQKDFEDARASILARELTADVRKSALDTRAAKMIDREKRLAEQQMQELAAAQKRLEDLQAIRAGKRRKHVTSWARPSPH